MQKHEIFKLSCRRELDSEGCKSTKNLPKKRQVALGAQFGGQVALGGRFAEPSGVQLGLGERLDSPPGVPNGGWRRLLDPTWHKNPSSVFRLPGAAGHLGRLLC